MIIKAPHPIPPHLKSVFLCGSIEMGAAVNWQKTVGERLSSAGLVVLDPRRDDWDSSWVQCASNPQFREQVEWELACLELATVILCYFDPETKSPITLLELGLHAQSGRMVVVCPDGFWRRGNVDLTCRRYGVPMYSSIETACDGIAMAHAQK